MLSKSQLWVLFFKCFGEWCKNWQGIDLSFQNWHEEFDKFWREHSKISKICTLMRSFWTKYIMLELKKYERVMFHDTEEWCKNWRETHLWLRKSHEEFDKFLQEHSKVSKLGLWWDPFIQNNKCMRLKLTEELCVMAMKNDAKFEEELTCPFKIKMSFNEFWPKHSKVSNICALFGSFWTKYIIVWAKKVRRSYAWWHWRLIENLKEIWLVLSRMTLGIWKILTGQKVAIGKFWQAEKQRFHFRK